jgi:hypothetical protein
MTEGMWSEIDLDTNPAIACNSKIVIFARLPLQEKHIFFYLRFFFPP